jgi:hypothetical protein
MAGHAFPALWRRLTALSSRPIGAVEAIDPADGETYIYAATQSGMFRLHTQFNALHLDRRKQRQHPALHAVRRNDGGFTIFGDKIIAANRAWPGLQVATIGSGSFSTIAGAPTAAFVETFGDRVWALGQIKHAQPR